VADSLAEFTHLCEVRELALLNLLGVVQHAVANLNLNDPPTALRTLMGGLEVYDRADQAITEFHEAEFRKQSPPSQPQPLQSAAEEAA
jgi:hypothetical protein